jgi:hypothetical protein
MTLGRVCKLGGGDSVPETRAYDRHRRQETPTPSHVSVCDRALAAVHREIRQPADSLQAEEVQHNGVVLREIDREPARVGVAIRAVVGIGANKLFVGGHWLNLEADAPGGDMAGRAPQAVRQRAYLVNRFGQKANRDIGDAVLGVIGHTVAILVRKDDRHHGDLIAEVGIGGADKGS